MFVLLIQAQFILFFVDSLHKCEIVFPHDKVSGAPHAEERVSYELNNFHN